MVAQTIDRETEQLAERYSVDPAKVRRICIEWEQLDRHGVPLLLSITGLTQLSMRPSWADFGIAEDDARAERLSTGLAKLFPDALVNRLKTLENRYRYWLSRMSFNVGVYKPFRYMLDKTWPAWQSKKAELDAEWAEAVAALTEPDAYDRAQAMLVADYTRIADAAYTALHATAAARGMVLEEPYDSFLQRMIGRATQAFPSREQLIATLKVDVQLGLLQNPMDVLRFVLGSAPDAHRNGESQGTHALLRSLQSEQARRMLMDAASPLAEVVDGALAALYRDASSILIVLSEKEHIPARTVGKIHGLRDHYQLYSMVANEAVEGALDAIGRAMVKPPSVRVTPGGKRVKYDLPAVVAALNDLKRACRKSAEVMAELHPGEWGDLGEQHAGAAAPADPQRFQGAAAP